MEGLIYITLEQAKVIHQKTIQYSGGGTLEELDIGLLDGVLEHIKNDEYYPAFEDKITHLFFSTCKREQLYFITVRISHYAYIISKQIAPNSFKQIEINFYYLVLNVNFCSCFH